MTEGIIIALITGACSCAASIFALLSSNKKLVNDLKLEVTKNQAITDTKLEELTREVRLHNNFAQRMPVVEEGIENLKEKVNYFHKI